MNHLQKLRTTYILRWVASNCFQNHIRSSETLFRLIGSFYFVQNPRLYRTKKVVKPDNDAYCDVSSGGDVSKVPIATREAQAALLEYLHSTRNLQFLDAEHMSKNSPYFLEKILNKVGNDNEENIGRAITRFFRYHPVNEFEPFFESLGLKPCEYSHLLPRDLIFLNDDDLLLENYHVLCNYGFARKKIGMIYKEATEVFRYDFGVLRSKLQAFEKLGLSQSFVRKVIVRNPKFLVGDVNLEFIKVLEILKSMGIEFSWIGEHSTEQSTFNWRTMFSFLSFCSKIGCSEEQLRILIRQHPEILLEDSGNMALSLVGFLLKFGTSMNEICLMFQQFPQIKLGEFFTNLRQCVVLLNEIEMEAKEIGNIVRTHPVLLGTCALKKTSSLLTILNVGRTRLCAIILENPQEMKKWVMGCRLKPLPRLQLKEEESDTLKAEFLLEVGFEENSKQFETALKDLRTRARDLRERFDLIVEAGLERKDVCDMVRVAPLILKQKKEVLKTKIDYFVNDLGYPISSLKPFPQYLMYNMKTVKCRLSMYSWLKDRKLVEPTLALSTIITCSDKLFVTRYVNRHPGGHQVWQSLKNSD